MRPQNSVKLLFSEAVEISNILTFWLLQYENGYIIRTQKSVIRHFMEGRNFKHFDFSTFPLCKWRHYATARQWLMTLYREVEILKISAFRLFYYGISCFMRLQNSVVYHYVFLWVGGDGCGYGAQFLKNSAFWRFYYGHGCIMRQQSSVVWRFRERVR